MLALSMFLKIPSLLFIVLDSVSVSVFSQFVFFLVCSSLSSYQNSDIGTNH